jgi:dienelactone hydrolase
MAEVVVFHSVLGLRPGVLGAAERLQAAGHTVHTPDLFDGEVFDNLDDGMRKEESLGFREVARRTEEAVARLPAGLVFAGFSMGVAHAERLTASRPGTLGVQVHYAAYDPWVEVEQEVIPLGDAVRGAGAEFEQYVYPGSGHIFADPDFIEYDRASSEAMWERVIAFLDRIDAR